MAAIGLAGVACASSAPGEGAGLRVPAYPAPGSSALEELGISEADEGGTVTMDGTRRARCRHVPRIAMAVAVAWSTREVSGG